MIKLTIEMFREDGSLINTYSNIVCMFEHNIHSVAEETVDGVPELAYYNILDSDDNFIDSVEVNIPIISALKIATA